MKKLLIAIPILLFLSFTFLPKKITNVVQEYPPKIENNDIIIKHKYYELCWDCRHMICSWVYYRLTDKQVQHNADRQNDFRTDPLLIQCDATLEDYNRSGYDRGHLANAEDMAFDKDALSESFYMTNMTPQIPGFNRGIWKSLETQVRQWAKQNKEIYIVTGTILGDKTIGQDHLNIPSYCYKAILFTNPFKTKAYLLKNESSDEPLDKFIVSVDSLEKLTHQDFFIALPDSIENRIEKIK